MSATLALGLPQMTKLVCLGALVVLVASCDGGRSLEREGPFARITTADSVLLEGEVYPTITIIIDPKQCLSCGTSIGAWREIWARQPSRIRFVLSEEPDSATLIVLKRARLPVSGVLTSDLRRRFSSQSAYIIRTPTSSPEIVPLNRATPDFASAIIADNAPGGS